MLETSQKRRSTPNRKLPYGRAWNIAVRTAHIAVAGVLLGGHVFNVSETLLFKWLYATMVTGGTLALIEAWPRWIWFCQGRGLFVLVKISLLCLIPWLWSGRVAILMIVVVLASVGSHMPGRFRYYSVLHRRVVND